MIEIKKGGVTYTEYDDTPLDDLRSILDWIDWVKPSHVYDVMERLKNRGLLNKQGIEVFNAFKDYKEENK